MTHVLTLFSLGQAWDSRYADEAGIKGSRTVGSSRCCRQRLRSVGSGEYSGTDDWGRNSSFFFLPLEATVGL